VQELSDFISFWVTAYTDMQHLFVVKSHLTMQCAYLRILVGVCPVLCQFACTVL